MPSMRTCSPATASTPASSTGGAQNSCCCPGTQPLECCLGTGVSRCLRRVLCSIIKIDFFTLTFRQLERLVRQGVGERFPGWEEA